LKISGILYTMSGMRKPFLVPLIVVGVFFVAAAAFGTWAFMSRQDYKDNSDQKVAAAVKVAQQQTATSKDNEFVVKEKLPLRTYRGPSPYGSLLVKYPKTWSAYVSESSSSATPVNGYFNPGFVPGVDVQGALYALRVQVLNQSYSQAVQVYQDRVKAGQLTAKPFISVNNKTVTGLRFDGQITGTATGSLVALPLRDKTLLLWTESPDFVNDFNSNILPNFSFAQ
jgi:hypothetical protein